MAGLKTTAADMVAAARAKIEEVETPDLIEFWVDPDSPYFKEVFGQEGKRYVFHCASGWRSALTVATLQDMGFEAAHLKEGFSTWEKHGGPVEFPAPKE